MHIITYRASSHLNVPILEHFVTISVLVNHKLMIINTKIRNNFTPSHYGTIRNKIEGFVES